jgi:hypothetical protein
MQGRTICGNLRYPDFGEGDMVSEKEGMGGQELPADLQQMVDSEPKGRKRGLEKNFVDTTKLVRSIQRAEGNPDCFRRAEEGYCDRVDCSWRRYCLHEDLARPEVDR